MVYKTKRILNELFLQLLLVFRLKMDLVIDILVVAIAGVLPLLLFPHILVVLGDFPNYESRNWCTLTLLL